MTKREFNDRLATLTKAAARLFSTADGEVVLSELEQQFVFGDLLGESPERTAFNLGAREVVLHLRALTKRGQNGLEG